MDMDIGDGWKAIRGGGLMDRIGPLLSRPREGGGWAYALRTDAGHANPLGLVHGGVITSLLDHALALTAWEAADRTACVTVQIDTQFMAAARPGSLVEAQADLQHRGGSLLFLTGRVSTGGQTIAQASAIMKIAARTAGASHEQH